MATAEASVAWVSYPMAREESFVACVWEPKAMECCPAAWVSVPMETALSPEAVVWVRVVSSFSTPPSVTFPFTPKPMARDLAPEASAFSPMATETALSLLLAFVFLPRAMELAVVAVPPSPAKELLPEAVLPVPKARESFPLAMESLPKAVALSPRASVRSPNAVA